MSSFVYCAPLSLLVLFAAGCDTPPVCGDKVVEAPELCDDGNDLDGDGCNNLCALPACGDGAISVGEACDDGNDLDGDGCDARCVLEFCGDGALNNNNTETCDDGNLLDGDGCAALCVIEVCGDGVLNNNNTEACDDGVLNSDTAPDACRADCALPGCGDAVVDAAEACDDGNEINADACRTDCSLPTCRDGLLDAGEACDDGNEFDGDGCRANCTLEVCGDGVLDVGEACDDGNALLGDGCRVDCTLEVCGDDTLDPGEACDDGVLNSDTAPDACRADCVLPGCGDAVVDTAEACDDGNTSGADGCSADCAKLEVCGDNVLDAGEVCDDNNTLSGDGCRGDCLGVEVCGDGLIDVAEQCDNRGTAALDGCTLGCEFEPLPLRLVAGNLTSGNFQSYDLGHGTRIFQGLEADVVMIQEFNFGGNSASALRGFVNTAFGPEFSFFREGSGNGDIPNGVVSRFPILEAGEFDDPEVANRDFVFARLDLPNSTRDLWVVSLHLLTSGSSRPAEADALVGFIQANIPPADYLVLGGDLNTNSRTESAIVKLGAVVLTAGPHPADQGGNDNTNANRSKPFDWVLVDAELDAHKTATAYGSFLFPAGMVFDSRLFSQTDLNAFFSPVLLTDSGAPSMQHMAVVRDFIIPVE